MTFKVLLNWRNRSDDLPENWVKEEFLPKLTAEEHTHWDKYFEEHPQEIQDEKWHAAKGMVYHLAVQEAKRLGYRPILEIEFNTPICLIEMAKGHEAGQELIKKWGFAGSPDAPQTMWDIMGHRREGDAIIGLIGDDRGWDKDWKYYIVVAWFPQALKEEHEDDTYVLM